jgi:hypothetical protein
MGPLISARLGWFSWISPSLDRIPNFKKNIKFLKTLIFFFFLIFYIEILLQSTTLISPTITMVVGNPSVVLVWLWMLMGVASVIQVSRTIEVWFGILTGCGSMVFLEIYIGFWNILFAELYVVLFWFQNCDQAVIW